MKTLKKIPGSRNARYYGADNYFTFWFRFVYPNKSLIYGDIKIPKFNQDFNRYVGMVFEKIAALFLWSALLNSKRWADGGARKGRLTLLP